MPTLDGAACPPVSRAEPCPLLPIIIILLRIDRMQPFGNATKITLSLHCDREATPWCNASVLTQRPPARLKHQAAAHVVARRREQR